MRNSEMDMNDDRHIRVPAAAGVGRALLAAVLVIMVLYAVITLFGPDGGGDGSGGPGGSGASGAARGMPLDGAVRRPARLAVADSGRENGHAVRSYRRQPVVFRLTD